MELKGKGAADEVHKVVAPDGEDFSVDDEAIDQAWSAVFVQPLNRTSSNQQPSDMLVHI
jgi:hypothetical protein